ncbi:MAG: hypothetical protein LBD23_14935 [Oscillospiraceae bacterium]|jgi:hypothetical protein|nr:hypothetical protein [Oscillospiraceae bacterium]
MTVHNIDLSSIKTHGQTLTDVKDGTLLFSSEKENPLNACKDILHYYIEAPALYRLPLQVDMTVSIDTPAIYVLLGAGSIAFGNRTGRIEDICGPHSGKKINFHSSIPMNKFVNITIILDLKEMQILVSGEERYYSTSEKYMRAKVFNASNDEGFSLKIACDNRVNVIVKNITVTEYDETVGVVQHTASNDKPFKFYTLTGKPTFENCIAELPDTLRFAVVDIDTWIRTLHPIKFKRQLDKNGEKITYIASEQGFSYQFYFSGSVLQHRMGWYILTQGKPETWHRKANNMEKALNYLAQTDSAFAQRMFDNLYTCTGGYGSGCLAKTPYVFNGKKIVSCHGKLNFNMNLSEFNDAKRFINAVNEIIDNGDV